MVNGEKNVISSVSEFFTTNGSKSTESLSDCGSYFGVPSTSLRYHALWPQPQWQKDKNALWI